ncbi:MAG: hypothetical protein ACYCPM_08120 [Acidobacteriaceae bacterium]
MRYWRLSFVFFLLAFTISGCHRRPEPVLPPPQAQAPIISTLPPIPPLDLQTVQLATSEPQQPSLPPLAPAEAPKKKARARRRRTAMHKPEGEPAATESRPSSPGTEASAPPSESGSSTLVGKLSADDSTTNPDQTVQTQRLIESTERLLKNLSPQQQAAHKDTVSQVGSFLAQAKQALNMNDLVGAQTLANKARILLDELSK